MINNTIIMNAVSNGTQKLGLIINQDETMMSSDFLSYGKVPVYQGNILPLEAKRWSRITCVTSDQVPSLANIISTIATNAITVSQHSPSILDPTLGYVYFGLMAISIMEYHDSPPKRNQSRSGQRDRAPENFLNPPVGGVSGTSLTRFLIRQFPDPVTVMYLFKDPPQSN